MEKNKIKVGILTMSDGRPYLHAEYEALNFQYQHEIAAVLEASGNFEVIEGRQVINTNTAAKEEGMRLLQAGAEIIGRLKVTAMIKTVLLFLIILLMR